jgi:hypothetical protein
LQNGTDGFLCESAVKIEEAPSFSVLLDVKQVEKKVFSFLRGIARG